MPLSKLKLTTCLWFDNQAEEAANFYVSVFPNSKIVRIHRYLEAGKEQHHQEPGSVMLVELDLDGHAFVALQAGPHFKFNPAISFDVECASQDEVDYYWDKLSEGGDPAHQQCGWLSDKFGVSWQIVPSAMKRMLASDDKAAAGRAMLAMMQMKKMDIATLEKAFSG